MAWIGGLGGTAGAIIAKRGGGEYGSCPAPATETCGPNEPAGTELLVVADEVVTGHTTPPEVGKPVPESVDRDNEAPDPAVEGDAMGSAIAMDNSRVRVRFKFSVFLRKSLETNRTKLKEKNY